MTELTMKEMARKGGLATKAKHPEQFKEMAKKRWHKNRMEINGEVYEIVESPIEEAQ